MFRIGQYRYCFLNAGASQNARVSGGAEAGQDETYPFGVPVNLSSRMVTRLIEPQL